MNKKLLMMVTMITLGIFMVTTTVFAGPTAPDPSTAPTNPEQVIAGMAPPSSEPWFKVEPGKPRLEAGVSWCINDPLYGMNYYLNEQTYAGFNLQFPPPDEGFGSITNLYGSYLFDFGLFIGLDYFSWGSNNETTISPGFRYNIEDNAFLAASFDLKSSNSSNNTEISGYKIDGQYYDDTKLISAAVSFPKDSPVTYRVETNFRATPELIWGITGNRGEQFDLYAGLTWSKDAWVVDTAIGSSDARFYYAINGWYQMNEQFNIGLEGKSGSINTEVTLKAKYLAKLFSFNLMYTFDPAMFYLTYKLNL